jgi:hypothetical protein
VELEKALTTVKQLILVAEIYARQSGYSEQVEPM